MLKEITCQLRILYSAKISFRNEEEIKYFSDEKKPEELVVGRPTSKKLAKASFLKRKKMGKEEVVGHTKGEKT